MKQIKTLGRTLLFALFNFLSSQKVFFFFFFALYKDPHSFCRQESEVVYCGRLSLVADLLQGLFKDAYTLQKGLLELLEKMPLNSSASQEEILDIVTGGRFFCTQFDFLFLCLRSFFLFNVFSVSFPFSDSQSAGYLPHHLQPGHGTACKHVEISY